MSDQNVYEQAFQNFIFSPVGQLKLARKAEAQFERFGDQPMGKAVKSIKYNSAEEMQMDAAYTTAIANGDVEAQNKILMRYGQKLIAAREAVEPPSPEDTTRMDDMDAKIDSILEALKGLQPK